MCSAAPIKALAGLMVDALQDPKGGHPVLPLSDRSIRPPRVRGRALRDWEKVEQWLVVTATVPTSRDEAAALVLHALAVACTAGDVRLIGSMAERGKADAFSDIDVCWTIPPEEACGALQSLHSILQRVGVVESLRVDPEPRRDSHLVFVRFRDWPLWWRVDLEIQCAGLGSLGVPGADAWSPCESACMGVIVTLKAIARNRPEAAEELWARALRRVDAVDVVGDWELRIGSLLEYIAASCPPTADLVSRTRELSREVLSE